MAKNWEKVEIVIDNKGKASLQPVKEQKTVVDKKSKDLDLRHIKTLSYEDLKKEGEKEFEKNRAVEDSVLEAYNDKKLKSQALIKKAKIASAKRAKETAIAQEKAARKARRDNIVDTNTALA